MQQALIVEGFILKRLPSNLILSEPKHPIESLFSWFDYKVLNKNIEDVLIAT